MSEKKSQKTSIIIAGKQTMIQIKIFLNMKNKSSIMLS